ncbi:hypothetical protein NUW54_g13446 [Trametes sanguinea]|uniref:Uncharacterized protein n=1 Tax=Trametes sanguinea TaxID=158606 RepID=A0ACC1MKX9_9APHY|nr:hypothetical protein NUW54_g13446 [Trametes sanguinea]
MSSQVVRHSDETRPLLHDRDARPQSYRSANSSRTQSPEPGDPPVLNKVSRSDLMWVLAGLWSAVFLGALDGEFPHIQPTNLVLSRRLTRASPARDDRRDTTVAHRQLFQRIQSVLLHRHILFALCMLFYTSIWYASSFFPHMSSLLTRPCAGRLSDILGRKGAMLLALSFFGLGTLFCGLAPSMDALIAARALAGMGGGGVMTVSSVAVTDLIPLRQRGLYQGMTNILFGLGAGLGGPLGGWMNDYLGWYVPINALEISVPSAGEPSPHVPRASISLSWNVIVPVSKSHQTQSHRCAPHPHSRLPPK